MKTEEKTFLSLFESEKEILKEKLEGMTVPKDADKIKNIVTSYLSKVFDGKGEYRMKLTQSEDYILQAAMMLLSAQQKMISEFASMELKEESSSKTLPAAIAADSMIKSERHDSFTMNRKNQATVLAGTAIGSIGGGLVLGTWGSVFGSIAGTAIALYCAMSKDPSKYEETLQSSGPAGGIVEKKIDTTVFLNIVKEICESVDSLIDTYRIQIKRVISKYESQEKPTLESEYMILLQSIQSMIGFERTHDLDDRTIGKMKERIEDVADMLENYNIKVVDYDGSNEHLFDMVSSANAVESRMVYPAFVKGNCAILKGKVFTK